jgi:hypothetical protein
MLCNTTGAPTPLPHAHPPAHTHPDLGRQATSMHALGRLPVARSVSHATSPAQST